MRYLSTRGKSPPCSFIEAMETGLAPDGGLYVPERFPSFRPKDFMKALSAPDSIPRIARRLLLPFVKDSFSNQGSNQELNGICRSAFNFPVPLRILRDRTAVLELFHGPTAAFKDVGARFLAACTRARGIVLVATSGDTGAAVAAAFHAKPGTDVLILYPKGKISPEQEKMLTCWGGNVHAFAVQGTFDDCQRIVKEAFNEAFSSRTDTRWRQQKPLISANSINIGRLLPQMVYYAKASMEYERETGRIPGFIVPTGNLGNAMAALWAKRAGFPIRRVVLATNANRAIVDFIESGALESSSWKPANTIATLANAMDVGNPSNVERLIHLYSQQNTERDFASEELEAYSINDEEIRAELVRAPCHWGQLWCPHTVTAARVRERLKTPDWILVATAHAAKFKELIQPLVGEPVETPPQLKELLRRKGRATEIGPSFEALKAAVEKLRLEA